MQSHLIPVSNHWAVYTPTLSSNEVIIDSTIVIFSFIVLVCLVKHYLFKKEKIDLVAALFFGSILLPIGFMRISNLLHHGIDLVPAYYGLIGVFLGLLCGLKIVRLLRSSDRLVREISVAYYVFYWLFLVFTSFIVIVGGMLFNGIIL